MFRKATFVTEKLETPVEMPYRMIKDLFHAGHHPINPLVRDDGLIEYERGTASVGITPHGEMILMSTTDIDDMELEHRFLTPEGKFVTLPPKELRTIPFSARVAGRDILGNGNTYLGQFIKKQVYAEDNTNYHHILGVAAWTPTPKQLVQSLLHEFSLFHRQDLLDSGILMRHGPEIWTSKEVVYSARPQTTEIFGQKTSHTNKSGEQLYTLRTLTSPRKGWNAARLYHEIFTEADQKNISRARRTIMRFLFNRLAEARQDMTMPEIKAHIDKSFSPTAKLLRQGASPYMLTDGTGAPARAPSINWFKGKLKQAFATAVFGLHNISKFDFLVGVVLPTAIALGGPMITEKDGFAVAAVVPAAILLSRFGLLWFARTRTVFEANAFSNIIHHFWPEGTKHSKVPNQFEMIRPEVIQDLRILPRNEFDIMLRTPVNKPGETPSWNSLYLIGMMNGPYGSHGACHKVGDQWVIRTDENKKSSGLNIEYWPLLNVAFAKNPESEHLPQSMVDGFNNSGRPICMTYAKRDQSGYISGYGSCYLTQKQYDRAVADMQKKLAHDIYRPPELTGKHLTGYPLPAIHGTENAHEESEWAAESKVVIAAEATEVIAEVAKMFFKGPR